uniref:sulfatase-like hydrolase/transferase n=3 Tax=uncultured Brachyspira sp. TaxID=221953 RepID=UPI0025CC5824
TITVLFILLISLAGIERKGYLSDFNFIFEKDNKYLYSAKVNYYSKIFKSSDIFEFKGNTSKLTKHIEKIEFGGFNSKFANVQLNKDINDIKENADIYYTLYLKSYSINIYIFLLILTFILNIGNFYKLILNDEIIKYRDKLIFLSCLAVSLLSGIFIPSSLIGASPQEFSNPFYLILNNLSMSLGMFLFYPLFIYYLFSERIKNYIALLLIFTSFFIFINTFIMTGNYLNINSDFIFDNSQLLISSFKDIFMTLILIILSAVLIIFILKKKRTIIFINTLSIILIVFVFISVFNIYTIIKSHSNLEKSSSVNNNNNNNNNNNIKIFNLSKTGENIFVFILDRAVNSYWIDALDIFPEYKEKLDGFTIYPNTVSFSSHTVTIASLYGGYDYLPYELSTNGNYNIKDKHNEALLMIPTSLEQYGYKSSVLEPVYANFNGDLSIFKNYTNISAYNNNSIDNYSISKYLNKSAFNIDENNKINQKNDIIRFSIFRMLPINLRYDFYRNGSWFNLFKSNINSSVYYYAIFSSIKDFINIKEDKSNYYNILHNMITHEPQFFSSDYLPHTQHYPVKDEDLLKYKDEYSVRHFYANIACINVLIDFIEFLKINEVYDNTKIILISDHGAENVNTLKFTDDDMKFYVWFNALFMYKDFRSSGNIKIDTNFMTIADMPYFAVKHIPNIKNTFNNNIITNDYKTNGAYIVKLNNWDIGRQFNNNYNFSTYYFVKDNIFDKNNWKRFKMDSK